MAIKSNKDSSPRPSTEAWWRWWRKPMTYWYYCKECFPPLLLKGAKVYLWSARWGFGINPTKTETRVLEFHLSPLNEQKLTLSSNVKYLELNWSHRQWTYVTQPDRYCSGKRNIPQGAPCSIYYRPEPGFRSTNYMMLLSQRGQMEGPQLSS